MDTDDQLRCGVAPSTLDGMHWTGQKRSKRDSRWEQVDDCPDCKEELGCLDLRRVLRAELLLGDFVAHRYTGAQATDESPIEPFRLGTCFIRTRTIELQSRAQLTRSETQEEDRAAGDDCEELQLQNSRACCRYLRPSYSLDLGQVMGGGSALAERLRPICKGQQVENPSYPAVKSVLHRGRY